MKQFSIKERGRSFKFAFSGLRYFFKSEHNGWIHLTASAVAIFTGITLNISTNEWLWIISAIFIVFIAEFFNTAIERTVDLITEEKKELAKQAKDIAAAGVFLAAIFSIIVAAIIFYPYIIKLINFF